MADNFVGKLRDLGWTCGPGGGSAAEAPVTESAEAPVTESAKAEAPETDSAQGDDTEVLIPADESEPSED